MYIFKKYFIGNGKKKNSFARSLSLIENKKCDRV
jgi:hypothetical protein